MEHFKCFHQEILHIVDTQIMCPMWFNPVWWQLIEDCVTRFIHVECHCYSRWTHLINRYQSSPIWSLMKVNIALRFVFIAWHDIPFNWQSPTVGWKVPPVFSLQRSISLVVSTLIKLVLWPYTRPCGNKVYLCKERWTIYISVCIIYIGLHTSRYII